MRQTRSTLRRWAWGVAKWVQGHGEETSLVTYCLRAAPFADTVPTRWVYCRWACTLLDHALPQTPQILIC